MFVLNSKRPKQSRTNKKYEAAPGCFAEIPNIDRILCKQGELLGEELDKVKAKQEMPFKIPSNI